MKSKTTAILICAFFGGIGGHCFYLDQTTKGVIRLLFCWTFIPAIISVFDFFGLIMMSDNEFNQKYNLMSIIAGGHQQQQPSTSDEIKKLYEMKEKGIITEEEFELKKRTML